MNTALQALSYAAGAASLAGFIFAVVNALAMVKHRAPGVSRWTLATQGIRFYSGKGFTPAAEPYRHRFMISVACFFGGILLQAVGAVLRSTLSP